MLRQRPSPALVISMIALFVALGSGAYAASKIDTKDIKKKAVTKPKIDNKAVTSQKIDGKAVTASKLARDSVKSTKIQDESLKTDDYGPGTVTSSKLSEGSVRSSTLGEVFEVENSATVQPGFPDTVFATCPQGTKVITGGWKDDAPPSPPALALAYENHRSNNNGWRASVYVQSEARTITVYAYCLENNVNG